MPSCHIQLTGRKPAPAGYVYAPKPWATIYTWESNRSSPALRFVPRIIKFLGYVLYDTQAESLGQEIVAARRRLGISQRELARRLGVDPGTLGRWETGKGRPSEMPRETAGLLGWPSAGSHKAATMIGPSRRRVNNVVDAEEEL